MAHAGPVPKPARRRFVNEVTGVLAGGLTVLAVFVLLAQVIAWTRGETGLGVPTVAGHLAGAVLAVLAQRQADRRAGGGAAAARLSVAVLAAAVLTLFWWL